MAYLLNKECRAGHMLTEQTVYWDRNGNRVCKKCAAIRSKLTRDRKRARKNGAVKSDHSSISVTSATTG